MNMIIMRIDITPPIDAYRDASEYMQVELRRGRVDSFMSTLQFVSCAISGILL